MIDITTFVRLLENEFEDIDSGALKPETNYREIPDFSSMHALIIIALIDNEFDVLLTGSDLRGAQTIQDLYDLVGTKLNE